VEFLCFSVDIFKLIVWTKIQLWFLEQLAEENSVLRADNADLQRRVKYLTEHPVLESTRQEIARLQLQNEQLRNQLAVVQKSSFKSFVHSFGKG
jgi:regulator of replication initiation timing